MPPEDTQLAELTAPDAEPKDDAQPKQPEATEPAKDEKVEPAVEVDWKARASELEAQLKEHGKLQETNKALAGQVAKLTRDANRIGDIEKATKETRDLVNGFLSATATANSPEEVATAVAKLTEGHRKRVQEGRLQETYEEVKADILAIGKDFDIDPTSAPELADAIAAFNAGAGSDGSPIERAALIERAGRLAHRAARELERKRAKDASVEAAKTNGSLGGTAPVRSGASGKLSGQSLAEKVASGRATEADQKRFMEELGLN